MIAAVPGVTGVMNKCAVPDVDSGFIQDTTGTGSLVLKGPLTLNNTLTFNDAQLCEDLVLDQVTLNGTFDVNNTCVNDTVTFAPDIRNRGSTNCFVPASTSIRSERTTGHSPNFSTLR